MTLLCRMSSKLCLNTVSFSFFCLVLCNEADVRVDHRWTTYFPYYTMYCVIYLFHIYQCILSGKRVIWWYQKKKGVTFCVCVCICVCGWAALLLHMSSNGRESTINSVFLEPLHIEWEDEFVSATFLTLWLNVCVCVCVCVCVRTRRYVHVCYISRHFIWQF